MRIEHFRLFVVVVVFFSGCKFSNLDDTKTEEKAQSFGKHLSKSASELDSRENYVVPQLPSSPSPQRSGRSVAGVLQRTHGFLNTLKVNVILCLM